MNPSPYRHSRWRFGLVVTAVSVLVIGVCALLYRQEVRQLEDRWSDSETFRASLLARLSRDSFRPVMNDLRLLADGDGLRAFLASGTPEDLDRAVRRAVFFSRQQPNYDQIRYLDERGQEILRVTAGGQVVPAAQLQNQAARPSFQRTRELAAGQIFLSPFDLSADADGRIERPLKPILRFSTPVFDETGRRRGAYVINYLGADLLTRLEEAVASAVPRLRVLNSDGYWIKAAQPGQEWGFMFPEHSDLTLARSNPALWERIAREREGQLRPDGGFFTWRHVDPTQLAGDGAPAIFSDERFLIVASQVTGGEWDQRLAGLRQIFLIVTPGLLVLVACTAGFFRSRQAAVATLRRNEEHLAVTLQSIGDGVLATDTRGRITRLNRVAQDLTGWSNADAQGLPVAEVFRIIKEGTREPAVIPVEDVLRTGEIHGLANHTVLIARDGAERAIADSAAPIRDREGEIIGVVLVFRDVTEERAAEIKLASVLAELDRFFTLSLDFLCISSADGYFKRVSPAVTDILGWTPKEFLAQPYISFIHPDDHAATIEQVRKQVVAGEKVLLFENRYRHKNGSWRILSWRSVPQGELMYATARDVTERNLAEEQIQQLNTRLQLHAGRLEAANLELESFSYSVSHDLRAPLRHIQGYAELLGRESAQLSEKGRRHLDTISRAARNMGQLIDDLLSFSRMGRTELRQTAVDPAQLVQEVRQSLELVTQDRAITWKIAPLPRVQADPPMLRQVFANLLGNAVKYSRKRDAAVIEIGLAGEEDGRIVFFIRDNGTGFDMQYADKLFGVFQRLHSADEFEGTGIGLANVRRVIVRHGGRTWAEGRPGEGATFYFTLKPALPAETPSSPTP